MRWINEKIERGDWGLYYYKFVKEDGTHYWERIYTLGGIELMWNEFGYWHFEICIPLGRSRFIYTELSSKGLWVQLWLNIKRNYGYWVYSK